MDAIRKHAGVVVIGPMLVILTVAIPLSDTLGGPNPTVQHLDEVEEEAVIDEMPEEALELAAIRLEELQDLLDTKLDLNRADEEAIMALPDITDLDARRIVEHRRRHGPYQRIEDLQAVGISPATIEGIWPFVMIDPRGTNPKNPITIDVLQRWTRRLDVGRGYDRDTTASRYAGSADALYTRVRLRRGPNVSVGFAMEKDPGEPLNWAPAAGQLGFDYSAVHAAMSHIGPIRQLILGDYRIDAGEGLLLGQAGSMMAIGPPAHRAALRPHTSSRESGYFRGAALRLDPTAGIQIATFYSLRRIDARYDSTDATWKLRTSGLHRTASELAAMARIREVTTGATLAVQRPGLRFSGVAVQTRHDFPDAHRRALDFSGAVAVGGPAFGFWGEAARRNGAPAWTASISATPAPEVYFWMQAFGTSESKGASHSFIGATGGRASRRERTVRAGVRFRPYEGWSVRLEAYWRRIPSHPVLGATRRASILVDYEPAPWLQLHGKIQTRQSDRLRSCAVSTGALRCARTESRHEFRIQADYDHSRALRTRFRIAGSIANPSGDSRDLMERGMLIFQDVRWIPLEALQLDGRLVYFDVSDFSTRIAAYENDLLYAFSVPTFSDRGRRAYVMARLRLHPSLSLQAKYSVTVREDVLSFGSGLDETDGSRLRELRIQLRWRVQ